MIDVEESAIAGLSELGEESKLQQSSVQNVLPKQCSANSLGSAWSSLHEQGNAHILLRDTSKRYTRLYVYLF